MARTPNERTLIQEDLLRLFRANNLVLNSTDRSLQSGFQNNSTLELQRFISGAKVRDITDVDGLETAPTDFAQPSTTPETWQIGYVQGYAEANMRKAREMKAGQAARELEFNVQIAAKMAEDADKKGIQAIAGNNWVDDSNSFSVGRSNAFLDQATGIESGNQSDQLAGLVNGGLRRVKQRYANLNVQGGTNVTGSQISGFNVLGNIAVVDNQAEFLADKGLLQTRSDVAAQSLVTRGVFSNTAYMGTSVGGFNWIGLPNDVIAPPTGTDPWDVYIVPAQGAVYGAFGLDPDSQGTYRVNGTH